MGILPPTRPLILDVKGNSLDDGPGIRTVVFFKGCPLDCSWCHNPESKRTVAELSFDIDECVDCGQCFEACDKAALSRGLPGRIERRLCDVCGACARICPSGALSVVGIKMDVAEVAAEVEKDRPFFEASSGGVTLSGGEPTLFMDYCSRLLARLNEKGIHAIVETCGQFDMALFEEYLLPWCDAVYYDLKIFDEESHIRECGAGNAVILDNFETLARRCRESGRELLPRVPLVPGITDTDRNLNALAAFIEGCGVSRVALLEYNPLWRSKCRKLGREVPRAQGAALDAWMEREDIERCRSAFAGLEVV